MAYRGELRSEVRHLTQALSAMSEREAADYTGPHLQPHRDNVRARYARLLEQIATILELEEDSDFVDGEAERERRDILDLHEVLQTQYGRLPTRGPLGYATLTEHRDVLIALDLMRTEVHDCAIARAQQESRFRRAQ